MTQSPPSLQIKKSKGKQSTSFVCWDSLVLNVVGWEGVLEWWSETLGHGGGGLGPESLWCGGVKFVCIRCGGLGLGAQKMVDMHVVSI